MRSHCEIREVQLRAPGDALGALHDFYMSRLGLRGTAAGDGVALDVGSAHLSFSAAAAGSEPFYHFAFLAPGDRFAAARDWLGRAAELCAGPGDDGTTFAFDHWNARACYALDAAGNIVEVIAHLDYRRSSGRSGAFDAAELLAISEIGLVVPDTREASAELERRGLERWDGGGTPMPLNFNGSKAHTLILSAVERPWLPTMRPAEFHPVEVEIDTVAGETVRVSTDDRGRLTVA